MALMIPSPNTSLNHRLVRIAIHHHNLIQAIDQRLRRRHGCQPAPARVVEELALEIGSWESERGGEALNVGGCDGRLAVEEGGDGHFIAAKEGAQAGESQISGAFGFKER
jgi:hypothetical protein